MRDPVRRRDFIYAIGGAAAWPLSARAQQPASPLIGVLDAASEAAARTYQEAFRGGLRELGYVAGRNVRFEYRYADGIISRLPDLAAQLVRLDPKVIVSAPLPANIALHKATSTIPIVMATGADPVGFGLVQSLSRPGGNMTGLTNFAEELASKQIDLIRALLPGIARLGVLVNVHNPLHAPEWEKTHAAAIAASLTLARFDFRAIEDLEAGFAEFTRQKVEAVLIPPDTTYSANRARIADVAARSRLPAIYFTRPYVEAGGLLSYGPNLAASYRRAAVFVDKILKGARPADLPIERPTKIELVINLKAARALGLSVPPALIARADDVIE
jgi:putative ABC transport system substrate-binding protein